ncbi:MAG: carbon storage regulator [Janthinobacterium lividum]
MKYLARKVGDSVTVTDPLSGDTVVVTVLEIRGEYVRLGFKTPQGVTVHHREIWDEKQTEKLPA